MIHKNKDKCTPAWMHCPHTYRAKEKRLTQAFNRYMRSIGFTGEPLNI